MYDYIQQRILKHFVAVLVSYILCCLSCPVVSIKRTRAKSSPIVMQLLMASTIVPSDEILNFTSNIRHMYHTSFLAPSKNLTCI